MITADRTLLRAPRHCRNSATLKIRKLLQLRNETSFSNRGLCAVRSLHLLLPKTVFSRLFWCMIRRSVQNHSCGPRSVNKSNMSFSNVLSTDYSMKSLLRHPSTTRPQKVEVYGRFIANFAGKAYQRSRGIVRLRNHSEAGKRPQVCERFYNCSNIGKRRETRCGGDQHAAH